MMSMWKEFAVTVNTQLCFRSILEEERHVRANDREYNERFSYAVSQ